MLKRQCDRLSSLALETQGMFRTLTSRVESLESEVHLAKRVAMEAKTEVKVVGAAVDTLRGEQRGEAGRVVDWLKILSIQVGKLESMTHVFRR